MIPHEINIFNFISGAVLSLLAAGTGFRMKSLSVSGAAGAFVFGTVIFGTGGLAWALPVLIFFFSSSLLSHFRKETKKDIIRNFDKSGKRDIFQVYANGGAAIMAAVYVLAGGGAEAAGIAVYGTFAAANADTWATEIGVLSRSKPLSIINFKSVNPGVSGGISPLGTLAAISGSVFIAAPILLYYKPYAVLCIAAGGLTGSFSDSLLGATVQRMYYCRSCDKMTERKIHYCGKETILKQGFTVITNDIVNFLACSFGAAVSVLLYIMH